MAQKHLKSPAGMGLSVVVRDNNVDKAMRVLKKKVNLAGVFREAKERSKGYVGPSEAKRVKHERAIARIRKADMKKTAKDLGMSLTEYKAFVKKNGPTPR